MPQEVVNLAPDATLCGLGDSASFEVAVLGAGAAGMAAAVFAALAGARVILIERSEYLGGTSAYSGGTTWIPNTLFRDLLGAEDSPENALAFLDSAVGNRAPRALRQAFVENGPEAVRILETRTEMKFRGRSFHPDYLSDLPGATSFGRALEPEPFDATPLGSDLALIRPTIPEFTILGGMMVDRDDIAHLLRMKRNPRSALYAVRMFLRFLGHKRRFGRDARLVMGNAMIARLLASARKLGVIIATRAEVTGLLCSSNGSVDGLSVEQGGHRLRLDVSGGVILASGGFTRHPARRQTMLPQPVPEYSPSAPGHTGRLQDMALELGAHYPESHDQPCFWAPVSLRKRADGSTAVFPHFVFDRSKPGVISVGRDGRRFVNESTSYHLFGKAMFEANSDASHIPCHMIADSRALMAYGMGAIRPGGYGLRAALADGYVTRANSVQALAKAIGVDPAGLADSVARMNRFAETGVDEDFARGTTVYERANGDASHGPNPTLGKLSRPPYYAMKLYPADIGASIGLVTDPNARVQRRDGSVIEGLYAVGNDAASIMGGTYPGPGITIGPGITFGYIAARHAAGRAGKESLNAA